MIFNSNKLDKRLSDDTLFDYALTNNPLSSNPFSSFWKYPSLLKTDIIEKEDAYVIYVDVPGFNKEDISVTYDNDYLQISAKRSQKEDNIHFLHKERIYGEYERKFFIASGDQDNVTASLNNGVLELVIKKTSLETKKNKEIKID